METAKTKRWRIPVAEIGVLTAVLVIICSIRACARFIPHECVVSYSEVNGEFAYYQIDSYYGGQYLVFPIRSNMPEGWIRVNQKYRYPALSFTWKFKWMKCPDRLGYITPLEKTR